LDDVDVGDEAERRETEYVLVEEAKG